MPITLPNLDDRRYPEILADALARIPAHTPEWTNFNKSDPGVTLIEVFAFMAENLLYRANQIPERNRRKFLQLLGVGLQPTVPARGLVTLANDRGEPVTVTLPAGIEVSAGQLPFRLGHGLDVLPVEAYVCFKQPVASLDPQVQLYYAQLYGAGGDSEGSQAIADNAVQLYETIPLDDARADGVDLGRDTVDRSLWIALLARRDVTDLDSVRRQLGGKVLSLGLAPAGDSNGRQLAAGGTDPLAGEVGLQCAAPKVGTGGADYLPLQVIAPSNLLQEPAVVQILLPGADALGTWSDLGPLDAGTGDYPPALDDARLASRIVTWLRLTSSAPARTALLWAGINAAPVEQRAAVSGEQLGAGDGAPDQARQLARAPVVDGSLRIRTIGSDGVVETWTEIDDLAAAGPEFRLEDPKLPPAAPLTATPADSLAFALDPESGLVRFGDGLRGKRPPVNALIEASYDYSAGAAGNVGKGAVNGAAQLPAGFSVSNPLRTWGGADAEDAASGEKQIASFLKHRDRLVTAEDFATLAGRTPGIDLGRVEVLPAWHPALSPNAPGDAPGVVTLMLIPRHDAANPDAPLPDRAFLDAVCRYLDPRRLVTTEVLLRKPEYKPVWISVGIDAVAQESFAVVRERVRQALRRYLSPLPPADDPTLAPPYPGMENGWPLRKAVVARELFAVVARVPGVIAVNSLELAETGGSDTDSIPMKSLQLPRIAGLEVSAGDAVPVTDLQGRTGGGIGGTGRVLPVPFVPAEC